jgi:CheY-like chemotaxis protein
MSASRILAVENDPLVLSFLEAALASAGYEVDTAANGREALEKMDGAAYALVVSDLRMPELDGLGLCRALRSRGWDALRRVLVLTTPDVGDDHRAFLRESGVATLIKPVTLEALCAAVEHAIAAAEPREPAAALAGGA